MSAKAKSAGHHYHQTQTNTMQNQASTMPRFGSKQSAPTAPVTADSLSAGWQSRTLQEALDEVARELGVRERIYAKWVMENKHTVSDAADRMQRMILAAAVLDAIIKDDELCKQVSCRIATPDANNSDQPPF